MITNFDQDKVYFAKGLYDPRFKNVASNLENALHCSKVNFEVLLELESHLHIWIRDFMPIQVSKDKIVRFRYEPDYLRDAPEYIPETAKMLREKNIDVVDSDVILDGGNVISCGDKVVMTDKIFKENPHYIRTALIDSLERLLEAEVVLIPWDRYERYGHADGMVRYVGKGRVLINNYCDFDKSLRKKMMASLSPHFDVAELHYENKAKYSWAYINFLHVGKQIFVPKLDESTDDEAFNLISSVYSDCECHAVEGWQYVVRDGGAMNCSTWTVVGKDYLIL